MAEDLESLVVRGYRYALSLTHDPASAEDLVQDAWLAILRREAPRHVGYLFRSIRNRFLDLQKRRRLVVVEALETADEVEAPEVVPLLLDLNDLDRGLRELRAAERELLFLTAVEGYTVAEAADLTGQPLGTVSSLVQRARKKLRRLLGKRSERRHG